VITTARRRFEFQKRSQFLVQAHNEALTVAAMCISNEDCSSRWNPRLRRSPNSNRLCSDCQRRFPSTSRSGLCLFWSPYGNYKNLVSTRARWRFQRVVRLAFFIAKCRRHIEALESQRQPRVGLARKFTLQVYRLRLGGACNRNLLKCRRAVWSIFR
jgi:hypothetical protein